VSQPGEAAVVPVALGFKGRTGYTVWAPPWFEDGEEWQAFLGAGGRVWLFESLDDLAATLSSEVENDLSDHPSWPMLQTLPADQLEPEAGYQFDLDAVPELTEAEVDERVVDQVADSVDIVERIAECCDNGTLLRLLEQPGFADLLGVEPEPDDDEDELTDVDTDEPDDVDTDELDDEDDAWAEIGQAIRTAWPLLLDRLDDCVEWRTAADLPRPAAASTVRDTGDATGTSRADDDAAAEGGADDDAADEGEADEEFWDEVGILPVEVHLPSGVGYTLRCYVDDEPRFLGADLTVDLFREKTGLVAFCQADDSHDLAGLDTWGEVREAAELDVTPPATERYLLTEVDAQLVGGPAIADVRMVRAAVDLVLDLAEYCDLAGVQAALADDAPLGAAVAELFKAGLGGTILPTYWSGEGAAAQWRQLLDEVESCVRWHG